MEIKQAEYLTSSPSLEFCPAPDRPEVAFIGRSNVGKSSLINMLCRNSKLAKTSATPGKTRLINHFKIRYRSSPRSKDENSCYFVDLPGYGFAKVPQTERRRWQQMIEQYVRKRENLANLFVLVDGRHKPQRSDLDFIMKLGEWRIPFAIIFTKTDKEKPQAVERNVNEFMKALEKKWEAPPVFFISSSLTQEGRKDILNFINNVNNSFAL